MGNPSPSSLKAPPGFLSSVARLRSIVILPSLKAPALRVERLGSRRHTENALKETSIQEFDGHVVAHVIVFLPAL
jgi:hypothetical protein